MSSDLTDSVSAETINRSITVEKLRVKTKVENFLKRHLIAWRERAEKVQAMRFCR